MHATAALRIVRRGLATAAAHPPHVASSSAASSTTVSAASAIPLSNVEAQWATLSSSEQAAVHQQLEELQQKDWKTLSLAEKKAGPSPFFAHMAQGKRVSPIFFFFGLFGGVFFFFFIAYYVAFGPHGPRAPVNPTGTTVKVAAGVAVLIASAGLIYGGVRSVGMFLFSLLSFCELTGTCSPAATKDDHEGVGRGLERACQGAQNQPHYRSV